MANTTKPKPTWTSTLVEINSAVPMGVSPGDKRLTIEMRLPGGTIVDVGLTADQIFTLLNGGSLRDVSALITQL